MTTKRRLLNKIRGHLRAAGVPRYIQRQGRKWYTTAELVLGLAVREAYRLSYRRAAAFLDEYYDLKLHWTTLQKAAARLPAWFWHRVLQATAPVFSPVAAVDGTGYARRCPSEHYLKRIDGKRPRVPVKLSILIDVETRKVLSARVRVKPAHDVRDVHGLIRRVPDPPQVMLADKGYDSEPLHEWLDQRGIRAIIPTRKGCRHGRHRKRLRDRFPEEEYPERNIVESVFKRLKALYGGHVRGRTARTVRAELFTRLILNNIIQRIKRIFY
jgi:transposase